MTLKLHDLPIELLYDIHLESLSSDLPSVSRFFRYVLTISSTSTHRATFLLLRHPKRALSFGIKYPICDLSVVLSMEKLVMFDDRFKGEKRLKCKEVPRRLVKHLKNSQHEPLTQHHLLSHQGCTPTAEKTDCPVNGGLPHVEDLVDHGKEITSTAPTIASKQEAATQEEKSFLARKEKVDLPLISCLLTKYNASPNSHKGYILARAVFARHFPLIILLLEHGADPTLKQQWAIMTAVESGDLEMVRLLIEVDYRPVQMDEKADRLNPKRRKVEDRCPVTQEMLEIAVKHKQWPIVDYLTIKGKSSYCTSLRMVSRM